MAVDFLQLVVAGEIEEAYQKYIGPNFRHHNPYFKGDEESLKTAMKEDAKNNPNKILEIQRTIREGNLVVVHSKIRQHPEDTAAALVHIFRFSDNKIAEAWDIGQEQPENSPNQHGMF